MMIVHTTHTEENMTTTEHAAEIRTALKKRGWNSRHVSVKSDCYSLGSAIRVTVKDPSINIEDVQQIAEPHECIHRCEITGEILGGGNRYVDVSYSSEALAVRSARYLPAVTEAAEKLAKTSENSLSCIEGTKYLLGKNQYDRYSLWSDTHLAECYDLAGIAREIAYRVRG